MFSITKGPINPSHLRIKLQAPKAGALATFEGWVRNQNEGREVLSLEYECFEKMAQHEAEKILAAAKEKFPILDAIGIHRIGKLELGEVAVWIGVTAIHRQAAFEACQYIINHIKIDLPIWKKEHYSDGDSHWVNCQHCAINSL